MTSLSFSVIGLPAPQGSKRHVGRGIMIESSKAVKPWREAVKTAARAAMAEAGATAPAVPGAVYMLIHFYLPCPKKYAKNPNARPQTKPDLSKLIRATEDALTDAGAWEDDARVVDLIVSKWYAGKVLGWDVPGAEITIEAIR